MLRIEILRIVLPRIYSWEVQVVVIFHVKHEPDDTVIDRILMEVARLLLIRHSLLASRRSTKAQIRYVHKTRNGEAVNINEILQNYNVDMKIAFVSNK